MRLIDKFLMLTRCVYVCDHAASEFVFSVNKYLFLVIQVAMDINFMYVKRPFFDKLSGSRN
jgi:hypothetical protein